MTAQPIEWQGDTRARLQSWGLLVGAVLGFVAVEVLRLRRDGWSAIAAPSSWPASASQPKTAPGIAAGHEMGVPTT